MRITWLGHSSFKIESGKSVIIMDPFLSGNPAQASYLAQAGNDIAALYEGATHVVLTHGHDDHVGDTVQICKATGAKLIANFDLAMWLSKQGVEDIDPGNTGGTLMQEGFSVTFTQAQHSSAHLDEAGMSHNLGNANGIVMHFVEGDDAGKSVYHMGDTDIFGDMALIEELHQPQIGLVPIGDRFTMGGAVAALACRRYFNFKAVLPCHYGSFPVLAQNADLFKSAMKVEKDKNSDIVHTPALNEGVEL
jgi:L-ascorbate metabolism protein UlaG (beta-lactamase superfamily)